VTQFRHFALGRGTPLITLDLRLGMIQESVAARHSGQ
jgi:hypothetical protein